MVVTSSPEAILLLSALGVLCVLGGVFGVCYLRSRSFIWRKWQISAPLLLAGSLLVLGTITGFRVEDINSWSAIAEGVLLFIMMLFAARFVPDLIIFESDLNAVFEGVRGSLQEIGYKFNSPNTSSERVSMKDFFLPELGARIRLNHLKRTSVINVNFQFQNARNEKKVAIRKISGTIPVKKYDRFPWMGVVILLSVVLVVGFIVGFEVGI
jgi:hypothetical protein